MMAVAVRAADRRGRGMTRVLWLIMPTSGLDDRVGRRRRPAWMARCRGVLPLLGDGADRGRRRGPSPSAAPAAQGLASCRCFTPGRVTSALPVMLHGCHAGRRMVVDAGAGGRGPCNPCRTDPPMWVRSAYAPAPAGTTTNTGAISNLQRRYWRVS
jgi:hypothetical protein